MLRVGYYVERPNERNFIVGCVHLIQLDYLYSGWSVSLCITFYNKPISFSSFFKGQQSYKLFCDFNIIQKV